MKERDLDTIISDVLSGEISDERIAGAIRIFEQSSSLQEELAHQIYMDTLLKSQAGRVRPSERLTERILARVGAVRSEPGEGRLTNRGARPGAGRPGTRRIRWGFWGSIAACLAIILGSIVYNLVQVERFPEVLIARVQEIAPGVRIIRNGNTITAVVGIGLLEGDRIRTPKGGHVRFTYEGEDSTVTAGRKDAGETDLTLGGPGKGKELSLHRGDIRAVVAPQPQGRPMVVKTSQAKTEVRGTSFVLRVKDAPYDPVGGATWLAVDEGMVRLTRLSDGKHVDVAEGELAVAGSGYALKAYEDGTRYVDGPIVFSDTFERGLGNWRVFTSTVSPVKEPVTRRYENADDLKGMCIRVVEVQRDGTKTNCMLMDTEKAPLIIEAQLKWGLPREVLCLSWTVRQRGRGQSTWRLGGLRNVDRTAGPAKVVAPTGTWRRLRIEMRPYADEQGRPFVALRNYQNDVLVGQSRWVLIEGTNPSLSFRASGVEIWIDDVIVRKRIEVDRTWHAGE